MLDGSHHTFEALGTEFAVELDDDPVVAPTIRAIVGAYPPSTRGTTVTYRIQGGDRPAVWRDGAALYQGDDLRDVAPTFELDFYQQASARARDGWLLHAAAVHTTEGAVVLAGPSGAGKTTLCLALLARGRSYITEEMVILDVDGTTRGLTRPLHLTEGDPRLANLAPGLTAVPYELRGWTGATERHVLLAPSPAMTHTEALPLRVLVKVRHEPGKGGIHRLPPAAALMTLWGCTLRQDPRALEIATTLIRTRPVYELRAATIADALRFLGAVVPV